MSLATPGLQEFFTAEALCRGRALPPEASRPWAWSPWWTSTLDLGGSIGVDFASGLLKASSRAQASLGAEGLALRSLLGSDRPTALRAIGMLLRAAAALDARDNRLTDAEIKQLAWPGLADSATLTRLNLAGNRISPEGASELANALSANGQLRELDLSRNKICGADGTSEQGFVVLAGMVAESGELTSLSLSGVVLSDELGCMLMDALAAVKPNSPRSGSNAQLAAAAAAKTPDRKPVEGVAAGRGGPAPTPSTATMRTLTKLDLSHNRLGGGFAEVLLAAVPACPRLAYLDLSHNHLGVAGGLAMSSVMEAAAESLRHLNLAANNLCNLGMLAGAGARPPSPTVAAPGAAAVATGSKGGQLFTKGAEAAAVASDARGEWTGEAIVAMCEALSSMRVLQELVLCNNGLCGLWAEVICGTHATRGTYTSAALDALVAALEDEKLSLKPVRESLRLDELVAADFAKAADGHRVAEALKVNGRKPLKGGAGSGGASMSRKSFSRRGRNDSGSESFGSRSHSVVASMMDGESFADGDTHRRRSFAKRTSDAGSVEGGGGSVLEMARRESLQRSGSIAGVADDGAASDAAGGLNAGRRKHVQAVALDQLLADAVDSGAAEGAAAAEGEEGEEDGLVGGQAAAKAAVAADAGKGGGGDKGKKKVPLLKGGKGGDGDGDGDGKANPFAAKVKKSPRGSKESPRGGKSLNSARGKKKDSSTPRGGGASSGMTPRGGSKRNSGEPAASHRTQSSASASGATDERTGAATERTGGAKASAAASAAVKPGGKKKRKEDAVVEEVEVNPFASAPLMIAMSSLKAATTVSPDSAPVGGKIATGSLMRVSETQDQPDGSKRMLVALDGDVEKLGWVTGVTKDLVENLQLAAAGFTLMKVARTLICRESKDNTSKKLEEVAKDSFVRVVEKASMPDGTEKALVAKDGAVAQPHGWVALHKVGKDNETMPNLLPVEKVVIKFDLKVHSARAMVQSLERKKSAAPTRRRGKDGGLPFQPAGRRPPNRSDAETPSRHRLAEEAASIVLQFNCHNAAFEITEWSSTTPIDKLPGELQFDLVSKKSRKRLGMVRLAKELGMPFLERVDFADDWIVADEHGLEHDGWQGAGTLDLEFTWGKDVATMRVHPWLAYGCSVGARFLIRKPSSNIGQCATVQRILADDRVVARVDGYSKAEGVKGETIVDVMPTTIVRTTLPSYPRDTKLLLLHSNKLVDATVLAWLGSDHLEEGSRHMVNIKMPGAPFGSHAWPALNNFNHIVMQQGVTAADLEQIRLRYCQFLVQSEDKVEDAITGNSLEIKDQLIFMTAMTIAEGCNPPEFMPCNDVPFLVNLLVADSPKRQHGQHSAQAVLCRAGPGTGKTWMIKQSMFLLACFLGQTESTPECSVDGVRLVPVIVFVQRIVRLLRELGDDPSTLLADPDGMMRWYISNEFSEKKDERMMLLQAWEIRAVVILVDGVDEAAGLRDIVEAFVHYELVPSGNRLVVTSRPEGVDLADYKTRFVVMNLLELSQEQQRNVIQMQLQGNAFFEHLVNIAEARKDMDATYLASFRHEALRNELEVLGIPSKDPVLLAAAETGGTQEDDGGGADDGEANGANRGSKEEGGTGTPDKQRRGSLTGGAGAAPAKKGGGASKGAAAAAAAAAAGEGGEALAGAAVVQRAIMVRRRLSMDNHQDLVNYVAKIDLRVRLLSSFLEGINKVMLRASRTHGPILDHYEAELRALPTPCTRSLVQETVQKLMATRQSSVVLDDDQISALVELGMQRKLPIAGGRRGAKAAPMPVMGLWWQVLQHADDRYVLVEQVVPTLRSLLAVATGVCGIRTFGGVAPPPAADGDEAPAAGAAADVMASFRLKPAAELSTAAWLKLREPVSMWIDSTYTGNTEPTDPGPEVWCATALIECETGEQCLQLLRKLQQGVEVGKADNPEGYATLTLQSITNKFAPEFMHPTHLRSALCDMLLTVGGARLAIRVQVEHTGLLAHYVAHNYALHYDFFWGRVLSLTQAAFDAKFESLLLFLVEAIGVPVLLSLLLLTYSNSSTDVIDLDDLPQDRLQLYKLGIVSGIRKRLQYAVQNEMSNAAEAKEEEKEEQVDGRPKREKRKGALELTMGGGGGAMSGPSESDSKSKAKIASNEPILDLNSVLRGKKVRVVTGEEDVAEAYSLVVRVLDKVKGADLRTAITAVVPKSHSMHAPVTALVEYVTAPIALSESALHECGKTMLRRVAVSNQENGRREFTSKHVACTLGANPEELGLWTRLEMDHDHGVALCATLAKQSDKAPAQYQFKHLSFQEGLYAEHLLLLVTSLAPPQGNGWQGWSNDKAASEFLNNRYMNNTCRIAAGHLGALLALQRASWDFRESPLSPNGRSALWFITDDNDKVENINVSQNDVSSDDVEGLAQMIRSCTTLEGLDLSDNDLQKLTVNPKEWALVGDALAGNKTLLDLNLNSNRLGGIGVRIAAKSLLSCTSLKRLGLSFNEPGVEPALADLLRAHPSLVTVEVVEAIDRHLPSRAKDDMGRALTENKAKTLGFLHCDTFVLGKDTRSLTWSKEASTSDAVLLAGVLVTNTVLTTFNIASGAQLANSARSALGEALLNNPGSRVAFCNDFGLTPSTDTCEFDLSRTELKDVEPFRLLAGCLRGNRTLTHVTLKQLRSEQIPTLALALRGNSTLAQLDIIHVSRLGGQAIVRLPVPELNGSHAKGEHGGKRVDMTKACIEGHLGRVACEMIGTLIAANTRLECIDLSDTGVGNAIGNEGEGGHILLKPLCDSKVCPLHELNLSNIQLNDKAGGKLLSSLSQGLGKKMNGYEKLTSLSLARNDLGKHTSSMLKECLWGERAPCMLKILDLSGNAGLDGYDTALAIKRNISLTSVDLRKIPSANTDMIYSFLGSFLLQDECACRLGFLSCDAFQLVHGLEQLDLRQSWRRSLEAADSASGGAAADDKGASAAADDKGKEKSVTIKEPEASSPAKGKGKDGNSVPGPVLMLLAGVLKFNSSLKTLSIKETGFDGVAAGYFSSALGENKVLMELDISSNPVDAEGIAEIAEAVRAHPALESVKVDGAALPVSLLRGTKGQEATLDVADWQLRHLSGHMIGAITRENKSLLELNLKNNTLGASGAGAVVRGLGDTPLRTLDLTRNGIGDGQVSQVQDLAVAICQHLGSLLELKMDENDLDCPAEALSSICKLRNIRVLSLEKNKLSAMPSLVGTMFSLKSLRMHTNQISELPPSICLLASLENLDIHKNLLKALPHGIGQLRSLQKFDVSENRLVELPIAICELNDTLQLSVGRNPLERPSIEQARQGVGSIRRFFGWSKKREDESAEEPKIVTKGEGEGDDAAKLLVLRPSKAEGAPSRHDWAQPAGMILLFNCHGCEWNLVEGGADLSQIPPDETCEMVASFNLQKVGKVREARKTGDPFSERIEFINNWMPWRAQDVQPGEVPQLVIHIRWTIAGVGKQSASIAVMPWLSYGVAVGARVRLAASGDFATVVHVRDDDMVDLICDNAASQADDRINPARLRLNPSPETVSRTSAPSYKAGQKLLLLLDGVATDAIVEEWLGLRRGSRHRVRMGTRTGGGDASKQAEAAGGGGNEPKERRGSVVGFEKPSSPARPVKETMEVDLNETNHTKLLFATVAKYEDAKAAYCERLIAKYGTVRDEIIGKELKVCDQRVFVRPVAKKLEVQSDGEAASAEAGEPEAGAGSQQGSPSGMRGGASPPPTGSQDGSRAGSPGPNGSRATSPVTLEDNALGVCVSTVELIEKLLHSEPSSKEGEKASSSSMTTSNAVAAAVAPSGSPSLVLRTHIPAAHELLKHQALHTLTTMVREASAGSGIERLLPLYLPVARLVEYMGDEMLAKQHPRNLIVKAFETDWPGHSDALKQAMEMRALVVVTDVTSDADLGGLREAMLEELSLNRLLVIANVSDEGAGLPAALADRSDRWAMSDLGLFMSELKLAARPCRDLLRKLRVRDESCEHYSIVSSLHLASADVGREAQQAITDLLQTEQCKLRSLDLSFTSIDGYALVTTMRTNASLTSLDVRAVPRMKDLFKTIGDVLLGSGVSCKLGCFRCDNFEIVEGQKSLNRREQLFEGGELRLIVGLMKHNTFLEDVDFSATDLESDASDVKLPGTYEMQQLATILQVHPSLLEFKIQYNPAIDEPTREALKTAAANREPPINLLL